jgi:hypothetical protein
MICQVEAQRLPQAVERIRQTEAALHQTLRGVQQARDEHWRILLEIMQAIGELL